MPADSDGWSMWRNVSATKSDTFHVQRVAADVSYDIPHAYPSDSGVYWCESPQGECSNKAHITVTGNGNVRILLHGCLKTRLYGIPVSIQLAPWSWRAQSVCPMGTRWLFAASWKKATMRESLWISAPCFSKMESSSARLTMGGWTFQLFLILMRVSTDANTRRGTHRGVFLLFLVICLLSPLTKLMQPLWETGWCDGMRKCMALPCSCYSKMLSRT